MILLDTSAVIHLLNGTQKGSLLKTKLSGQVICVSPVTVYEVLRGARENEQEATCLFFDSIEKKVFDEKIAKESVHLEKILLKKGVAVSMIDLFIAATCLVHNIPLATTDDDFLRIREIKIIST
ncbi:MAG: type II toxin-antitoxin system VapC family toxin [Candidatus Woesearchaeota archaeon]|nr:type II toxin-antitoxin system VapC family toxin [Candidatus Woesearchaeota archaeon]